MLGAICYFRKVGVPQSFFEGDLGSAKLILVILGSATIKRLKNTALDHGFLPQLIYS
jgi:hypothetical protein